MNNIVKHSKAKTALLELKYSDTVLYLRLQDDGIGFNQNEIHSSNRTNEKSGLKNINERCKIIGGSCEIEGNHGKGASINIQVPI